MQNTLYLVDDHSMVRNGLVLWLEANTKWKITGKFAAAKDCLKALEETSKETQPEIVIIDIQLLEESGFQLLKKITENYPEIKCLMYSMFDTIGYILQAKDLGAKGFISKVSTEEELVKALKIIQSGRTYMEPEFETLQKKIEPITSVLTKQEKLVFEMILQGKTNKQIESELFISAHTVSNYINYIYNLAEVHNRADFMAMFNK